MALLPETKAALLRAWDARLLGLAMLLVTSSSCGASPIDAEIEKSGGKLTVVEFVDYECNFCQDLHAILSPLLDEQQGAVRIVIKHVPLDKHAGAKRAAAAAICAEAQGKLAPMHDALMKGANKSDDGLIDLAQHVGLDIETFKACLRSDAPAKRIEADGKTWKTIVDDDPQHDSGLPLLFINRQKLVGMQEEKTLEQALRAGAK